MMGGILYLWRQSRNRKRSHRQTQAAGLEPSSTAPHALQSRPSQKQHDKKQKRNVVRIWLGESSMRSQGRRTQRKWVGLGRSARMRSGGRESRGPTRACSVPAVLHKTDTRPRPANGPVQHLASQKTNVTPGIGSGNGLVRLPGTRHADSHRKLSDNPFSNDHASRRPTNMSSPNASSPAKSAHLIRPSRPVRRARRAALERLPRSDRLTRQGTSDSLTQSAKRPWLRQS